MKIAVTGATGFVGRHLIEALHRTRCVQVVAVSRGAARAASWPAEIQHVVMDMAAPPQDPWRSLGRPDAVVHLAWSGLPNYRSRHHFEVHLAQQYTFLRGLIESGLPSLLCAGTCFEYGNRSGELDEAMCPDPTNAYAFAKDALRRQLGFLREERPFAFTWARIFYMYGAGQSSGSLYGQFRTAMLRGDAVFPMSPGDQLRDYLPVDTVASLLAELAMRAPDAGIVNVCSGIKTSVRDLVGGWLREEGGRMRMGLGQLPYAAHEPMAFWGSTAKLRSLLEHR